MSKQVSKFISVFIPVFNGEKYLSECLNAVINQELPNGYKLEVLVTDSGSTDSSLEILKSYNDKISITQIPNSEFTHGGTRQKAAIKAKGEFILFLTQDATPSHYRWLISMIEPFFINEKVGCVFGRQIPRPHVAPTIKREVSSVFDVQCAPDSLLLHRYISLVDKKETNGLNTFFSDANSAVRRSLLTGNVPFRNIHYAEDQALAEDMQKAGYLKAYTPQGSVWHSNEYTASEYRKRKFDEYIGLYKSTGAVFPVSRKKLLLGWIRPTLKETLFIIKDPSYSRLRKLYWLSQSPRYNIGTLIGQYTAYMHRDDETKHAKNSLESNMRKSSR